MDGLVRHDPICLKVKLVFLPRTFEAAKAARQRRQQFQLGWVEPWSSETPLQAGQVVAMMGWDVGCWWLNSCRIKDTVDEAGPMTKFGFAYRTLSGHIEIGEERFLIEWDQDTDKVFYNILTCSRPNHFLTRLG